MNHATVLLNSTSTLKRIGLLLEAKLATLEPYQQIKKRESVNGGLSFFIAIFGSPFSLLHCGAFLGTERDQYLESGIRRIGWCECQPDLIPKLVRKFGQDNVYSGVISDSSDREVNFYLASDKLSSSTLRIRKNTLGITVVETVSLKTTTLNEIISDFFRKHRSIPNFIVLDIQGGEFNALLGGSLIFEFQIPCLVKLPTTPVYEGLKSPQDLDGFMSNNGFSVVWQKSKSDEYQALYLGKTQIELFNSCLTRIKRGHLKLNTILRELTLRSVHKLIFILKSR